MNQDVTGSNGNSREDASPVGPLGGTPTDANSAVAETTGKSESTVEESQEAEVERLKQELGETKDRFLRTVAEMDNMRKRQEREKSDFIKFSNESILKDMVPILDSLEKAIPADLAEDSPVAGYREGVLVVQRQLMQMLLRHGLEAVEAVDKPFDPNFHQAIQRIESADVSEETVAAEFAKGYALNGRLLRPSMVSVKVPV